VHDALGALRGVTTTSHALCGQAAPCKGLTRAIKWKRKRILKMESHLRSAPVAASTLSGKRRPGAE
jgi:hypothetical protein